MFEISLTFMSQLIDLIVPMIAIYVLFDLTGSILFGKK